MNTPLLRPTKTPQSRPATTSHSLERLESRIAPATFRVTSLADSGVGSLRGAIDQANAATGPDLIFFVERLSGAIKLRSDLPEITDDVAIAGPGAGKMQIDGSGAHRLFQIAGRDLDVTISGLTLTGGLAPSGGAVRIDDVSGSVTIERCTLEGNVAAGANGTIDLPDGGDGKGGAIALEAGSLTISRSTLSANKARAGTAVAPLATTGGEPPFGIAGTDGDARGGAIFAAANTRLTISATVITGNRTLTHGGTSIGGGIEAQGTLDLSRVLLTGNSAISDALATGGGLFLSGSATVKAVAASTNTVLGAQALGGGICNLRGGTLTIENSTIFGNAAIGLPGKTGANGVAGARGGSGAVGQNGAPGEAGLVGENGADGLFGEDGAAGASGGTAAGGGLHNMGTLIVKTSTVSRNRAIGGPGGAGGTGGPGGLGGNGGRGGNGGAAFAEDGISREGGFGRQRRERGKWRRGRGWREWR